MNARISRSLAGVALVVCATAAAPFVVGCSGCQDDEVDPQILADLRDDQGVQISFRLEASEREEPSRLVPKIVDGSFPGRLASRDQNAKLFLYLAAKSQQPEVILASLRAMQKAYGPARAGKDSRPAADDDFGAVVAAHLKSQDPIVVNEALAASRHVLVAHPPHAATFAAVSDIAQKHSVEGARIGALNALVRVPNYRRNAAVTAVFLKALDDPSAAVLSHALYQLYQSDADKIPQRAGFLARTRKLLEHPDPGVRGRAARLAAMLAPRDLELRAKIRSMLDDEAPYTRSVVAHALIDMNDVGAIHLLVEKLEDYASNAHHLRYAKLGGGTSTIPHGAKAETVHDPRAIALEKLSAKLAEPYRRASGKHEAAERKKNVVAAKAWYTKHKGAIVALDAAPVAGTAEDAKADSAAAQAAGSAAPSAARVQDAKPPARAADQAAPAPRPAPSGAR